MSFQKIYKKFIIFLSDKIRNCLPQICQEIANSTGNISVMDSLAELQNQFNADDLDTVNLDIPNPNIIYTDSDNDGKSVELSMAKIGLTDNDFDIDENFSRSNSSDDEFIK